MSYHQNGRYDSGYRREERRDEPYSRPSSANSFDSAYSRNDNYRSNTSSYSGSYNRGPPSRFSNDHQEAPRGRFEDQVDPALMQKNAGQIGLDPTNMEPIVKNFYKEHPEVASMSPSEVEEFRKKAQMIVTGRSIPKPVPSFKLAGFPSVFEAKLASSGFTSPTPIQSQGWSMALSGQNMVGIAQTGSGKTLSFILPALVHIQGQKPLARGDGPIALVLAPTRELAVQIQVVARDFGNTARIYSTCLYGGAPKSGQIAAVRQGCELIVATPGRLLDLVNAGIFDLSRCSFLVLDEADRMLDMGFEPQIRQILTKIRTDRQVLMWSATWPKNVMKLAHDMLGRDFIQVKIGSTEVTVNSKIKQEIIMCGPMEKNDKLTGILQNLWESIPGDEKTKQMVRTIIFCNKKSTVDYIEQGLKKDFWPVVALHGDKSQGERDWAIRRFKSGQSSILVATDVAARGLDVKDVMAVVNFDLPLDMENYVHRIGRTARGDATEGAAHTFVTSEDQKQIGELIKILESSAQEVPEELLKMRPQRGPSRAGFASYGRRGGFRSNNGGGSYGRPSHTKFSPY